MKRINTLSLPAIAALCLHASAASGAELNMPVAAKVVSFLQPAPAGPTPAAIIFEPGNAASEAEAAAIERAVGGGLATGKGMLRTRRVPVSALGGLNGMKAAFVTSGLRAEQGAIAAAAARANVLTISADIACVEAGRCMVGVSPGARVQITVSRAALRASTIRFGSAFLMLVKEI